MSMNSDTEHWQEALRVSMAFARWRTLIMYRTGVHRIRHTLQGKVEAIAMVLLFLMLVPTMVQGFLERPPETRTGIDGLLLGTHLWLALTVGLMILVQCSKTVLRDRGREPLTAHPAHSPALNRHRVLSAVPLATLIFTGLFLVYFMQLLDARLERLILAIPVHLLTTGLLAISLAAIVGFFGRKLLRLATQRGIQNEAILINVVSFGAIGTFCALLLAIIVVAKHAHGLLEAIGSSIAVTFPIGMIPFAAALAADEGRWLAALGWLGLSAALALWSVRATYRWSFSAHREIPTDLAIPVKRVFAPVFTGRCGRILPAGVTAFWRKDIQVPYSREPRRYLFHQVNLLWWGIMAAILAVALRDRGIISSASADTIPVLMTLVATAVIAMQNGINALGREGTELSWLRAIFSGTQLLGLKLMVNLAYVLLHGAAYAVVVAAAAGAATLGTSFSTVLAYAICSGAVFACLAIAIGFLLPDFERMRSSLPGSSAVGKGVFLVSALVLIAISGTANLLRTAGVIDSATSAGLLSFAVLCAAVGFIVLSAAALRQYRGIEIC